MNIEIIFGFGTTETERKAVLPIGTARFDTSNQSLRVHNGVSEGGVELLPKAVLDRAYQPLAAELNALSELDPTNTGFMVRTGESSYRFVALSSSENVAVANGKGITGEITFTLKQEIVTQHRFTQPITFTGGLEGNLEGNVVGNVAGNLQGNVEGNVQGTVIGTHVGPVDARGADVQVDDDAFGIPKVAGLAEALGSINSTPPGIIVMWSGTKDNIPLGWLLCDGQNNTPDLRDRFILGGGSVPEEIGTTGGTIEHTHTTTLSDSGAHAHAITVNDHILTEQQIPSHRHTNGVTDKNDALFNKGALPANPATNDSIDGNSSNGTREGYTSTTGGGQPHSHGASSESAGAHTHAAQVQAANNIPPYIILCYIMFVG